jgi:radical SAM-linked protein
LNYYEGDMHVPNPNKFRAGNETMQIAIKFKIGGNLRFLSHAETLSLFQHAFVRAGIPVRYSQGFNPRPKLSLPLPRPVGVASDDELLCFRLTVDSDEQQALNQESRIKSQLSARLPEGCDVISVKVIENNNSIQPRSVTYLLVLREEYLNKELEAITKKIRDLLASDSLIIRRKSPLRSRYGPESVKNIDVRNFLKSINLDGNSIIVECEISHTGSIRVDEIIKLLELDAWKLAEPIRRTNVQWQEA